MRFKTWISAGLRGVSVCVAMVVAVSAAKAQESPTGSDARATTPGSANGNPDVLTEIIVTAQKRSERLIDVPLSITVASGDELQRQGITNPKQLERLVPGFTYQNSTWGAPVFTLRGVGFYDITTAVSPAVSVYVDQVPLPFSSMTRGAGYDLERVEVLKGPQGTLFGENSTGGAVNYIAAKPTRETTVGLNLDYGRFNTVNADAFISGPVTPTLRARLFARVEYGDPWQKEFAQNDSRFGKSANDKMGTHRFYTGRFLLDWDATDALHFELNVNGWQDRSETQAAQFLQFLPSTPLNSFNSYVYAAFANLQPTPNDPRLAGWDAGNYAHDDHLYQVSLRADFDLGVTQLSSITAYSRYHAEGLIDNDGTAFFDFNAIPYVDIKSFYQELRIASTRQSLNWMVGANYSEDISDERQFSALNYTGAGIGPFRYDSDIQPLYQNVGTIAAFGSLKYDFTNELWVEGSARYTYQHRYYGNCGQDPGDGQIAAAFSAVFGTPAGPGDCLSMVDATPPFKLAGFITGHLNQSNVSWRISPSYKPDPDTLLYVSVAKGYKSGAVSDVPTVFVEELKPATQESLLAYEAGFKIERLGHRVEVDGAGFYYDYKDKQILGSQFFPLFGNLPKLVNIPKSRVIGSELSVALRPVQGLTLSGSVIYVDSKVLANPPNPIDALGNPANFIGDPFPGAPKWQGTTDLEYRFPVRSNLELFFGGGTTSRSATQSAVFSELPQFTIHSYTLTDLRAGVESADGWWRVQLWGHNVTNRFYALNYDRRADALTRVTGMPATYGVSLSYKY